ncbi:MAG: hypothetical protein ACOC95_04205 [Planctomycetota bacterium]
MEASPFSILNLTPGRYTSERIDAQYRTVCRRIRRDGGVDRRRRLDDALVAHAMLRHPAGQAMLIRRFARSAAERPRRRAMTTPRPHPAKRPPASVPPPPAPPPTHPDAHKRFARMVYDRMAGGLLRMTARQELVGMARGLGIHPFKANLIIAEVLHEVGHGRRVVGRDVSAVETVGGDPPEGRYGVRVALAVAVAVVIDALLLLWLTGA